MEPTPQQSAPMQPMPQATPKPKARKHRDRSSTKSSGPPALHPAILAAAAVLAVLVVILGVLGGGDDSQETASGANGSDTEQQDGRTGRGEEGSRSDRSSGERTGDGPSGDQETGDDQAADGKPESQSRQDAEAMQLEIHQLEDNGETVELGWRSAEPLTYAVFVAEQGGQSPKTRYRGRGTTLTVEVEPGLKYCFQVQGTDGVQTFESEPVPIRGGTCES